MEGKSKMQIGKGEFSHEIRQERALQSTQSRNKNSACPQVLVNVEEVLQQAVSNQLGISPIL